MGAVKADDMTAEGVVATMHIGELSEKSQMSLRTIRHYDEVGLLRPLGFTLKQMADLLRFIDTLETAEPGSGSDIISTLRVSFH
jgi:MerR family copper efflux transcriptional regulator